MRAGILIINMINLIKTALSFKKMKNEQQHQFTITKLFSISQRYLHNLVSAPGLRLTTSLVLPRRPGGNRTGPSTLLPGKSRDVLWWPVFLGAYN
ncbi:hypothetical protein RND71_017251 [Anisodus tanguticus]|uniref:Uncharacterized protein n=1 Tax=Anisodus tanguticus TaxID=243964 RepID=A0AAE1S241_9SOLA|nr:hypothetical protein RND71_017251 [Anisodus tanguticus]